MSNNNMVELTEVKCYKVKALATGKELPMMVVSSEWKGFQELKTLDNSNGFFKIANESLIIVSSELNGLAGAFRGLIGSGEPLTALVIKASPSLAAKLQEPPAATAPQDETGPGRQSS